jgi:hypothetical protein
MHMNLTIDLDVTAASLQQSITRWVRVLPDDLLLSALDHYEDQEEISDYDAIDLIKGGLKGLLINEHRRERDRRLGRNYSK